MCVIVSLLYNIILWILVTFLFKINNIEQDINIYNNHTLFRYTNEELIAIEKFRPMVRDILKNNYEQTDDFLIRWIKANNFNLPLANSTLRKVQQWKEDNNWDNILEEPSLNLKNNTCFSDGVDRQGNLILYTKFFQEDIRKWVLRGQKKNFTRYLLKCYHESVVKLNLLSQETGKLDLGVFNICDVEGYNLKQHGCIGCIQIYGEAVKITKELYPGVSKATVVIKSPTTLQPLVDLMRPILRPQTEMELKFFGQEKKEWFSYLANRVSMDQLSKRYGGERDN